MKRINPIYGMNFTYSVNYYYAFLTILCTFFIFLFLNQFFSGYIVSPGLYQSDTSSHISSLLNGEYYSFFHSFLFNIGELAYFYPNKYVFYGVLHSIFLTLFTVGTILLVRLYFGKKSFFYDSLSISLLFVSMIIFNPYANSVYIGSGTGNIWHNGTYIATKLFSLLGFIFFVKSYMNFIQNKQWIWFSVAYFLTMTISVWIKPVFVISFYPTILMLLTFFLVKKRVGLKYYLSVGGLSLLSLMPLYWVSGVVYSSAVGDSIRLVLGELWYTNTDSILMSILTALAFPIFVYTTQFFRLSFASQLSLINLVVAINFYFFVVEEGSRFYDGNFAWPFVFSIFLSFLTTAKDFFLEKRQHKILYPLACILFLIHFLSGIVYFVRIFIGHSYL
ncbi:hypothetical protein AB6E04_12975 [Vibrio amylolyticus]|uniref:hypothetical protein n=1 Tax=Vibrio amylolyticus TaxID=2847292 RepID=UPI0035539CCA